MSQVNVNPPAGGPVEPAAPVGEPPGSTGAGMIIGIIVAILIIVLLVWFLVIAPGGGGGDGTEPLPSGWMLTNRA